MGLEAARPDVWDDPLDLWHGTTDDSAWSVLSGLSLDCCFRAADFGPGFYATTSREQALMWASHQARRRGGGMGIVAFRVPRSALLGLRCSLFVRGDRDADDYWRMVFCCRAGGFHGVGGAADQPYDVVAGPVARSFSRWSEREAYQVYDQWSFHTEAALSILDGGDKCGWISQKGAWIPMAQLSPPA